MSATTAYPLDIPYSVGSDAAASVDDTMRLLAERVHALLADRLPRTGTTGTLAVGATTTDYTHQVTFTRPYPAGAIPNVVATADTATATVGLAVDNVTNLGFRLIYRRLSGATNIGNVRWVACMDGLTEALD